MERERVYEFSSFGNIFLILHFNAQKLWDPRSLKNADVTVFRREKTQALYI